MRIGRSRCGGFFMLLTWFTAITSTQAQLWKQFVPTPREQPVVSEDLSLSEDSGPWLVMASSFSGNGAETQARELAMELRQRHGLPAYLHDMSFNYTEEKPGRGLDQYGAPIRRRYQREGVHEYAVLVGSFPAVDDPEAQQLLEKIKTMQPDALKIGGAEHNAQSLAQVREWQNQLLEKLGKSRDRGPMARAFMIRNPLLPREFFVPRGIDKFVEKMNDGVEHSLLDCPGKYTVKVATFSGRSLLQASAAEDKESSSRWSWRREQDNPLVEAAEKAHLLCEELRVHGWEAYEFHDRTESIVTIGSFEQVSQRSTDGRDMAIPQVQRIIETFGAAYDTPADPLSGIGNDPTTQQLVKQQEQQFNLKLNNQQAQVVQGMNPKHVKLFDGSGKRRRVAKIIPMDIHPHAMEVPARSISGTYAG